MKPWLLFRTVSCVFLLAAIVVAVIALQPVKTGVRIPVHLANGTMGYIDNGGTMVLAGGWKTTMPFGEDDRALVSVERQPSKIAAFFSRWIPSLHQFTRKQTKSYNIDRYGNATPLVRDSHSRVRKPDEPAADISQIRRSDFRWVLKDGSPAFPGGWQKALDFKRGDPAAVYENGRWGFIDKQGKPVLPFQWDETLGFDGNGRACVAMNRKWGVIDITGQLVIPLYFQSLTGFDDQGMCAAQLASGWGFIYRQGKIIVPFRYGKIGPFDRFDMAKVEITDMQGNRLCGWIDRHGEVLIPPIYNWKSPPWASRFSDHELLPVIDSEGPRLIDRKGRVVIATALGMLQSIEDPMAPDKFWIRTVPYLDANPPPGVFRPPFESICYDQTGRLIWNGDSLTSRESATIYAVLLALISAALFAIGRWFNPRKTIR